MNDILIHGQHLAGPYLVALDLLFALSGAAAGVKSKLDLFGNCRSPQPDRTRG